MRTKTSEIILQLPFQSVHKSEHLQTVPEMYECHNCTRWCSALSKHKLSVTTFQTRSVTGHYCAVQMGDCFTLCADEQNAKLHCSLDADVLLIRQADESETTRV